MALHVPDAPSYLWRLDSVTTRPAAAYGTSITPSGTANLYTGYTQLIAGAAVVNDVWFIEINVNSAAVSAAARDMIVTIGLDPAGGSSYTDTINHLLVTGASPYTVGTGGVWYAFPLFIPAGTSIGIKVSQNNTNTTAIRAFVRLHGQPTHPEITPLGYYVETLGADPASSRGTTFTLGTTSDGTYASVGTLTKSAWWFQIGYGVNDATINVGVIHLDVAADSAGNKVLIRDYPVTCTSTEQINQPALRAQCTGLVAGGSQIYTRGQSSNTADTTTTRAVYALGG